MTSASYDAANELTNWNGTPISYDLNGNMQSDGTNSFTWNARNQVASLNGRSLQYDAYGRRIQNQLGTAFLYDGSNAAQELTGGTVTANLLSGGIDEMFSRSDSTGTVTPLQDALGSTLALVDTSGNLATQYSYDPFGNTTVSGALSSNPAQYTGRENEGNGLYFYRARYYSPQLGRFISPDPIGYLGGSNVYAYTSDEPTDFIDPTGTDKKPLCITYFAKDAISTFFGGGPGISLAAQASGHQDLNIPFPINGFDIPAVTVLINQAVNTVRPIVIPGSKALRNFGGLVNLSGKQYLEAATSARLKTIGGAITAALADAALAQALYNEIKAFNNHQCRAIGYDD